MDRVRCRGFQVPRHALREQLFRDHPATSHRKKEKTAAAWIEKSAAWFHRTDRLPEFRMPKLISTTFGDARVSVSREEM
ncbi:hypothetical protein ACQEVS_03625 [Streptomyces sp. CA-181903]|uniref:hypothetical protein n=1 Tax=Streptomyces sp. CA-181903 TaxID=3240055 RepID=UPI003D8DA267